MLKDQTDLLLAFNTARVRYLLIGGYALGRYAEPRATRDMDVFVDASIENSYRTYEGLVLFGAPLAGYKPEDFQNVYEGFQIGAPPYQIDIIFAISGVSFEDAWEQKASRQKAFRFGTFPFRTSYRTRRLRAGYRT